MSYYFKSFNECQHNNYLGREKWTNDKVEWAAGFCIDCGYDMNLNLKTKTWEKGKRMSLKEAQSFREDSRYKFTQPEQSQDDNGGRGDS